MNTIPTKSDVIVPKRQANRSPASKAKLFPRNGMKFLFSFVCLIIPLLYWPPAFDAAGVPREMLIAVSAGIASVFFGIIHMRNETIPWHPVQIMMLGFLTLAVFSFIWSADKSATLLSTIQLASLIFLSLCAAYLNKNDVLEYVIPYTLIASSIAAFIAIGQKFGFNPLLLRMSSSSPAATFINPNNASNFFDLIIPIALSTLLLQPSSKKTMKLLASVAFVGSLSCVVICNSRGSWLSLATWLIVLALAFLSHTKIRQLIYKNLTGNARYLVISLSISLFIAILPAKSPSSEKIDSILSLTPDASIQTRLHIYQNALVGITEHPLLGVGYGAFISGFTPYIDAVHPIRTVTKNQTLRYMHSDPLQTFFELGIPGGLLILAIFLMVMLMAWKVIVSEQESNLRILGLGLLLALIASVTHSLVDFTLHLPTSAFFFWLWVGLITGLYLTIYPNRLMQPGLISPIFLTILGVVFLSFSIKIYVDYLRANRDVFTAIRSAERYDCNKVLKFSDKAMNEFGLDHLTRFWYAKAYTYCNTSKKDRMWAMDRILKLDPNIPLPYLTRAQIKLNENNLVSAASDFNAFRKLLPNEPDGYIGLMKIAVKLNDKNQAHYWLKQAQKYSSDHTKIKNEAKILNLKL